MKNLTKAMTKSVVLCLALIAVTALGTGVVSAAEVTVSGSTTGTVTGVPQLTFIGNPSFTGTTTLGVGSLSGLNSLGAFFLATGPAQLASGNFNLNINFTTPVGINGGQSTSYMATITGSIAPVANNGGLNINFTQPVGGTVFTFSNASTSGMFTLNLANVFIQSGQTAALTAGLTGSQQRNAPVPEPASMLLLGTGLAGISSAIRRRRKSQN